jgi:hypothetical protein
VIWLTLFLIGIAAHWQQRNKKHEVRGHKSKSGSSAITNNGSNSKWSSGGKSGGKSKSEMSKSNDPEYNGSKSKRVVW